VRSVDDRFDSATARRGIRGQRRDFFLGFFHVLLHFLRLGEQLVHVAAATHAGESPEAFSFGHMGHLRNFVYSRCAAYGSGSIAIRYR
jgi:hypothetical protein